ncbi:HepT-like ribonuclease domain-containing protein [Methanoculleus sp.]|nr:HepT-like ribonuclease domain-containing protein [Methanoculleus sp.]
MRDILIHAYFGIHNEIVWDELHFQCNCLRSPI